MKKFLLFAVVLIIAGGLLASNMGFKLTYSLTKGRDGNNWVSLPYYFGSSWDAADLCTDIGVASEVGFFDEGTNTVNPSWICGDVGTPFTLDTHAGKASYVKVASASSWTIVGSHDPSKTLNLTKAKDGNNWVSLPYHTTGTDAQSICTEISNASEVGLFDEGTNTVSPSWICGDVGTPFTVNTNIGKGLYVKVTAADTWQPAHY